MAEGSPSANHEQNEELSEREIERLALLALFPYQIAALENEQGEIVEKPAVEGEAPQAPETPDLKVITVDTQNKNGWTWTRVVPNDRLEGVAPQDGDSKTNGAWLRAVKCPRLKVIHNHPDFQGGSVIQRDTDRPMRTANWADVLIFAEPADVFKVLLNSNPDSAVLESVNCIQEWCLEMLGDEVVPTECSVCGPPRLCMNCHQFKEVLRVVLSVATGFLWARLDVEREIKGTPDMRCRDTVAQNNIRKLLINLMNGWFQAGIDLQETALKKAQNPRGPCAPVPPSIKRHGNECVMK